MYLDFSSAAQVSKLPRQLLYVWAISYGRHVVDFQHYEAKYSINESLCNELRVAWSVREHRGELPSGSDGLLRGAL